MDFWPSHHHYGIDRSTNGDVPVPECLELWEKSSNYRQLRTNIEQGKEHELSKLSAAN
jgi:hypothetical protein